MAYVIWHHKGNIKIEWPTNEDLISQLKSIPFTKLGVKLGVSDNAIRKHLKKEGIDPKTLMIFATVQNIKTTKIKRKN